MSIMGTNEKQRRHHILISVQPKTNDQRPKTNDRDCGTISSVSNPGADAGCASAEMRPDYLIGVMPA